MTEIKKLYRSDKDKIVSGIMGGMAEYFEVDSALFRLIALFLILVTGLVPGVIAYFLALLVVPRRQAVS